MTAFDWSRFIRLADDILQNLPSAALADAARRTAISRAYYGAFHAALALVDADRVKAGDQPLLAIGEAHGQVVDALRHSTDRDRKYIGDQLRQLKNDRHAADYDAWSPVAGDAEASVAMAKDIAAKVNRVVR